ncbi:Morn repeat domain containing protein [Pandoravirus salinus]|uniref:Morn repeat domain containing protein n=1 Tax=Pandoravirus salinus TaxID=1349410 RepID=S4VZW1_9VIRU|nr:morn repeat domain [Pandoravirus salinus]AGO83375.1 Morn repeat domain containing protein [Pandoravirus salinus]
MKRGRNTLPGARGVDDDEVAGLHPLEKRRRRQVGGCVADTGSFDCLPDELLLSVFAALDDPTTLGSLTQTSRRHYALGNDPVLWRRLCELRFGPLLHCNFAAYGKCWRWLYRAQARAAATTGDDVGAVVVRIRDNNYIYWGDCRNGLPHGHGLALSLPTRHCRWPHSLARTPTGPTAPVAAAVSVDAGYEGEWRDGLWCGRGLCIFPDGSRYDGEWCGGRRNGAGRYTQADGTEREGTWENDNQVGRGSILWPNSTGYTGEWKDNDPNGHGVRTWADGARYEGEFRCGREHGYGTLTYASGSRHEGEFEEGIAHGYGTRAIATGHHYEGQWKKDHPNGHGIYTWPDGNSYEGEFRNGEIRGYGVRVYPNGDRYVGYWKRGRQHGHGVITRADGGRYQGQWRDDRMDGVGTHVFSDGSCVRGKWARGSRVVAKVVRHRAGEAPCCLGSLCLACSTVGTAPSSCDSERPDR